MLLHIPHVLHPDEGTAIRQRLDRANWVDGKLTAGYQSAQAKRNQQLPEDDALAQEIGDAILKALSANPTFFAGALPRHIYPPLFNRYEGGNDFGMHVDNAVRYNRRANPAQPIRTDLSATLFLCDPEDYEGGELIIEDSFGTHSVKLPLGDMVLYPGSSLHRVEPVTRGMRVASFFWIQSLVRDPGQRRLLFDMDVALQRLQTRADYDKEAIVSLTGVYHNLLRQWGET